MPKSKFKSRPRQKFTTSGITDNIRKVHNLWKSIESTDQTRQLGGLLLTFMSRTQEEDESAASFLASLIKLAAEAGINGKKHVISQFIMGTRDVLLRNKLNSTKDLPSLEELKRLCIDDGNNNPLETSPCNEDGNGNPPNNTAFDMLFDRNVVHILEKIFLSLDYDSFKSCLGVSKKWNKLLSSDHFNVMTRHVFPAEMWMGEEGLNTDCYRDLGKSEVLWTSNGEEVAFAKYMGRRPGERSLFLQYIDSNGSSTTMKLPYKDGSDESFSKVYILKHVIVFVPDSCNSLPGGRHVVYVNKEDLSQREDISLPESSGYLQSSLGANEIIFAAFSGPRDLRRPACNSSGLWLGRISQDTRVQGHKLHKETEEFFADHGKCCIMQKCDTLSGDASGSYPDNNFLSGEGAWFVSCSFRGGNRMVIKRHSFLKDILRFREVWNYEMCIPAAHRLSTTCEGIRVHANSEYVFVLTPKDIVILSLDYGVLVEKIKLWDRQRKGRWSQGEFSHSSVVASQRYLLATRQLQNDEEGHPGRELFGLDLETFTVDRVEIMARFSESDHVSMSPFCGGRLVAFLEEYHFHEKNEKFIQLSILDMSKCFDLGKAFRERRVISDDFAGFGTTRRCHNGWFILDDIFDFSELSERVCAFQLLDNPTRMSRLQCLSWDSKKKKFPKALEEFLHSDRSEEMVSDEYEDSDSD